MYLFIGTAFADAGAPAATGGGAGDIIMSMLPIILMVVVFYFLLIRPQQKRMKQHRETLSQVRRGDRVLTSGGIIGTVSKVLDDNELLVEIADNVKVKILKATIADVLAKTEPAKDSSSSKENTN
jgi:preprotein translocase subunit YajC